MAMERSQVVPWVPWVPWVPRLPWYSRGAPGGTIRTARHNTTDPVGKSQNTAYAVRPVAVPPTKMATRRCDGRWRRSSLYLVMATSHPSRAMRWFNSVPRQATLAGAGAALPTAVGQESDPLPSCKGQHRSYTPGYCTYLLTYMSLPTSPGTEVQSEMQLSTYGACSLEHQGNSRRRGQGTGWCSSGSPGGGLVRSSEQIAAEVPAVSQRRGDI